MTNQRDANQTRDSRVANALMRRAPYGQASRFNTVGRTRAPAQKVGIEAGFGSARDAEMGGIYEAVAGTKQFKDWAQFSSGSVWNGFPGPASQPRGRYANNSWVDIRGDDLPDSGLTQQVHCGCAKHPSSAGTNYDNTPMVHENALTLRTGGAAAFSGDKGGCKCSSGYVGGGEDVEDHSIAGFAGATLTMPFRVGKALRRAAFGTARDLGRTPSDSPRAYAMQVGATPAVQANREYEKYLVDLERRHSEAMEQQGNKIYTAEEPTNDDKAAGMSTRRAQAHSATRGMLGSAHGARSFSGNVHTVGRYA